MSGVKTLPEPASKSPAKINPVWLILTALLIGGAIFFTSRKNQTASPQPDVPEIAAEVSSELAEVTQAVARSAQPGVTIHLYALLDPSHGTEPWRRLAERTATIINETARVSAGRIAVIISDDAAQSSVRDAALAQGLEPLRSGRDRLNFLGVAVAGPGGKTVMARLDPAWEAAFQFDLARAIARASGDNAGSAVASAPTPLDSQLAAEVLRALPELDAMTLDEARQELRARARENLASVVGDLQKQIISAQEQFAATGSETDRQRLQQLQREAGAKLSEIALTTQEKVEALERIKK